MRRLLAIAALSLAACAHPANIRTNMEFGQTPAGLTTITLKVKNKENRPTTPLLVDVSVQLRHGENWGKPASVIHPSAFVLSRQEEQILRSTIKLAGDAIKATITVKELETGRLLTREEVEKP